MHTPKILKSAIITAAAVGLIIPQGSAQAAAPQPALPAAAPTAAPAVVDIALSKGGTLRGQVVNGAGVAQARSNVKLLQSGREVAATQTDDSGNFSVNGLRGGSYTVVTNDGGGAFRLWSADTAPPSAHEGVLLVSGGEQVARGQGLLQTRGGLVMLGLMGGLVAAGVVGSSNHHHSGS